MSATDEQIEAAAKAMHAYEERKLGGLPWARLSKDMQLYWRAHARIALKAALNNLKHPHE